VAAPPSSEVADFLRRHPPFDTLDDAGVAAVARAAQAELHRAGALVLGRPETTSEHAYVVRRGAVELRGDGRLLDVVGEGELFGYASMLAERPLGFVARAREETLVYRIAEDAIRPVLERPAALRYVARSLSARLLAGPEPGPPQHAAGRPLAELIRAPPLVCDAGTPVRDAAARMVSAGATCVLVELRPGLAIVTDHDIRTRVVAAGAGTDTPLADVMTAPARTIGADRTGSEALVEMLDHGIRHLPVLDPHGRLLGVLDDVDLLAAEHRAPFRVRALIARAPDAAGVARAAAELRPTAIALHDAGVAAPAIGRMLASLHDTVTRRLIELALAELDAPPFTWLALGSYGRREPFPSSDVDCALAWEGDDVPAAREPLHALAVRVLAGLAASGLRPDAHGATADKRLFARPIAAWEAATRDWLREPDRDRGLMLLSVVAESTPVWGATGPAERLAAAFAEAPGREETLRGLAVAALAVRPPTGFWRDLVLEAGGIRKGALDLKRGGLLPVEALARWGALSAGVSATATPARLDASAAAGTLDAGDAAELRDAFEFLCALRMEHQLEQVRAGGEPTDQIEPARLTPLTRSSLKRAFRTIARVQRGIAVRLGLAAR
jgi:CBS domain-containing protein